MAKSKPPKEIKIVLDEETLRRANDRLERSTRSLQRLSGLSPQSIPTYPPKTQANNNYVNTPSIKVFAISNLKHGLTLHTKEYLINKRIKHKGKYVYKVKDTDIYLKENNYVKAAFYCKKPVTLHYICTIKTQREYVVLKQAAN